MSQSVPTGGPHVLDGYEQPKEVVVMSAMAARIAGMIRDAAYQGGVPSRHRRVDRPRSGRPTESYRLALLEGAELDLSRDGRSPLHHGRADLGARAYDVFGTRRRGSGCRKGTRTTVLGKAGSESSMSSLSIDVLKSAMALG
jgi:hypothetical protein